MWEYYHYGNGMGMLWESIFSILFWALIICGLLSLLRCGAKSSECKKESPMDILKRRYASGEINAEDFSRMKKDLES